MKLDSSNKRIIVFSDVHQSISALQEILFKESSADYFVCLGDWFDSHIPTFNTDYQLERTADALRTNVLYNKKFINLFGNHDLPQFYPQNINTFCSGYEVRKNKIINACLGADIKVTRDKTLWWVWIDNVLVTHAGLHSAHLPPFLELNQESLDNYLRAEAKKADFALKNDDSHWFFRAGRARGGSQNFGGIIWLDFDDEFEPIEGQPQIFGHSFRQTYKIKERTGNYCIDTNLKQYLVIENGRITIKDV